MKLLTTLLFSLCLNFSYSQYEYEVSKDNPYGKINPNAPKELLDFSSMIGSCDCTSTNRKPDGTWNDSVNMIWTFKYIMNGMAIQDETLKDDGKHSGSIRQYIPEEKSWFVHYYSSNTPPKTLSTWTGNKEDNKIILYKDQKAPNGMEGFSRLTFYNMSDNGYDWTCEWVDKAEKIVYPTWKISCKKRPN